MGRLRNNISKPNYSKNRLRGGGTTKNGPTEVEKSAPPVSTHTDVFTGAQQPAVTTMTEVVQTTTTMTDMTEVDKGLSTPTRGERKKRKEVTKLSGRKTGDGDEERKEGEMCKTYTEVATTRTMTTMVEMETTAQTGNIPVKPSILTVEMQRSSYRKGKGGDAKSSSNRPPGQGETPDEKNTAGTKQSTPTKLFTREPTSAPFTSGSGMTFKEKWLMEEDEVTVAAGKEDRKPEVVTLQPRRLYNHRFKLTVTGTGHNQRSKGFAVVVEAIRQMMVDIKDVTNSQPVLRPWRLSNKDSPTITEPRGVPRSESGLAPYLFDRFWDKVSGNYYAEIFLGFDGKEPAELAALTRTEGATVDQLPYFLTNRAIQDDLVECAGWLLGSTTVTDQERLVSVLAEAVSPISIDVARRRIPFPGENPLKQKMIFAFRIFVSAVQKNELATKLTDLYSFNGDKRGLDGKNFIFIPDASFYTSTSSVKNYDQLRDRQEKLERRLRTEIISDLKAEYLDMELDEVGNTLRNFLQSLLGPGSSKEKYLLHNVDVHDNVVKFQCFPNHQQSVTTICASLLTYMEHVLRNHRKGEAQEVFLNKLRKCFTTTARDFAKSCKWNAHKQSMETPADKHMEMIMKAVESRFAFDMNEMEVVPKSGIRARQEDNSTMTIQASLGLDWNCFHGEDMDKVDVVKGSIPTGVNTRQGGESRLKKPRPSEIIIVQQEVEESKNQENAGKEHTKEYGGSRILDMKREMDKMRDMMKLLQTEVQRGKETVELLKTEVQQGKDKMEEGKEREGKLQAEVHRLTLQLAGTDVSPGDIAGEQPATVCEVPDVDMVASEENETSVGVGNGTLDAPTAMDTGTPRKGAGGKA